MKNQLKNLSFYKKGTYFLVSILMILGCQNNDDPFKDSKLGFVNRNVFQSHLAKQGLITKPDNDSVGYMYNILFKKKKFPVEVSFNYGIYKFGELRDIYINLNGDTVYWDKESYVVRAGGPRLKKDVDEIYEIYCQWYGEPDSTYFEYPQKGSILSYDILFGDKKHQKEVDSSKTPKRTAFWFKDNFTLSFNLPFPEKEPNLDSALVYNFANINYEIRDYKDEIKRIKDSIKETLTPRDLISMRVYMPQWSTLRAKNYSDYDSKFEVQIDKIKRIDFEEDRGITGIRFDIVISDKFNKELYRIKDVTYEPTQPLMNGSSGLLKYGTSIISFTKYRKTANEAKGLEDARLYTKHNKIKVYSDIKSVVFDDGNVLESNK